MFSAYKCKTCGSVSKDSRHLCQAEDVHSRAEYCATDMLHDSLPDCQTAQVQVLYQCEGCGRSSDEPKLLCRPVKVESSSAETP